jgi:hypothetical protein
MTGESGMPLLTIVANKIEAILFDMNGTLRQRIPDEGRQRKSTERLLTMLGKPEHLHLSWMN